MTIHIKNKTRACYIGIPPAKADRKPGMMKIIAAGQFPYFGPGDVVRYEAESVWNQIQSAGDGHFVYCEDPAEVEEMVAAGGRLDPSRPNGFFGSQLVLENVTEEFKMVSHSERLVTAKRMAELERAALDSETAKTRAEQAESAKAALEKEVEALRAQLASERTSARRGR
jgi:uncharacterized membrane protein